MNIFIVNIKQLKFNYMKVTRIFIDETLYNERMKEFEERQKKMEEVMGKNPMFSNPLSDITPFSKNCPKTLEVDIMDSKITAIGEVEIASEEIKEKFEVDKFKRIWVENQMWYVKV